MPQVYHNILFLLQFVVDVPMQNRYSLFFLWYFVLDMIEYNTVHMFETA